MSGLQRVSFSCVVFRFELTREGTPILSDKAKKTQMLEHLGLGNAVKFNALLGLQGVDGICDASLASRDCTLSTGGAQES